MRRVYKYPIDRHRGPVLIPTSARVLYVGLDPDDHLCLWALVDMDRLEKKGRAFVVVGTGHDLPDGTIIHHGTFKDGNFMWHVFELKA